MGQPAGGTCDGGGTVSGTGDQPLSGVHVVDLSLLLPGPWATLMLAELGADVVHVEPPGGDPLRRFIPGAYASVTRGKRVIEFDLKSKQGQAGLAEMLDSADVVVEGFRPGAAARLGAGAAAWRARNPRLIHLSLNGYGSVGPYSRAPGHDVNYLALAGVLSLSGDPGGPPYAGGGVAVADLTASLFATQAILAALLRRERTGEGATLEVPIAAAALKLLELRIAEHDDAGTLDKTEMMSRGAYGAFRCADDRWISVGCIEQHFWERLCNALMLPDLLEDPRLQTYALRCRHAADLNERLAETFAVRSAGEWLDLLSGVDIPVAPVLTLTEIDKHPQVQAWNMIARVGDIRTVSLPYRGLGARQGLPG